MSGLLLLGCGPVAEQGETPHEPKAPVDERPAAPADPGAAKASDDGAHAAPVASASAPDMPAATPPAGPIANAIGTKDPIVVVDTAPEGHWVAFCQAREDTDGKPGIDVHLGRHGDMYGDAMVPYFAIGTGPEQRLDAFVGRDPSGRYVALVRPTDELVLLDTWNGTERVLAGARTDDAEDPFGPHRAAAFSDRHVAYVQTKPGGALTVVAVELATGAEVHVDPGPGVLGQIELPPGGERVVLRMVVRDTDGDGKLSTPTTHTSLAGRACRGPVMSFSTFGQEGDAFTAKVAKLEDGSVAREVQGMLAAFESGPLVRDAKGGLVLQTEHGTKSVFDAACGAQLLHVAAERDAAWAVCAGKRSKGPGHFDQAPIVRFESGVTTELGLHGEVFDRDELQQYLGLLHALENKTINTATGTVGAAVGGMGYPELARGDELLFLFGKHPMFYDLATEKRTRLKSVGQTDISIHEGTIIAAETGKRTTVFDAATRKVLGTTLPHPMAVASSGHVLLARHANVAVMAPPDGPLKWHAPKP